jgi:biotin carboxylase
MDKFLFRQQAEKANIPLTKAYFVETKEEAKKCFKKLGSKTAVIKASNLGSCLGVKKVTNIKELEVGFEEINKISSAGKIIEEYVEGKCYDVNGLVIKRKFYPCGVIERKFTKDKEYFVQKEMTCPTTLDKKIQKKMYLLMEKFAKYLKIHTSPVKADFLYDGNNIYMLEFSPRFHGAMSFLYLIPNTININAMEAYLRYRFNGKLQKALLREKLIDEAICRANIKGKVKSNYDISKYIISFKNKRNLVVSV